MVPLDPVALDLPTGAPNTWLLDASGSRLDEAGLRERARALASASRAAFTSRSYRHPYALVACHTSRVGVDIERIDPLDPAFVASISTPEELRAHPTEPDRGYAASLWSSKEALAKALGNAVDYDPRRLPSPLFWPEEGSGPWRALCLPVPNGHVAWLCWRAD